MGAVHARFGFDAAPAMAVAAGADAVLVNQGDQVEVLHAGLVAAVRDGRLDEARLDEAVGRVLALRGQSSDGTVCPALSRPRRAGPGRGRARRRGRPTSSIVGGGQAGGRVGVEQVGAAGRVGAGVGLATEGDDLVEQRPGVGAEQGEVVGHERHPAAHAHGQRPRPHLLGLELGALGAQHQAVGVVQPEAAVQERAAERVAPRVDGGRLAARVARRAVLVGLRVPPRRHVGADAHAVDHADGGAERRAAAEQEGVVAGAAADGLEAGPHPLGRASGPGRRSRRGSTGRR